MPFVLIVRPQAQKEALRITRWLEQRGRGLGVDFRRKVAERYNFICEFPKARAIQYKDVRVISLERFRYRVFWRVKGHTVEILGIRHFRMNPDGWPEHNEPLDG